MDKYLTKIELLLHCFDIGIDEDKNFKLEQLSDDNWYSIVTLANKNRVSPLLYSRLKKSIPSSMPEDAIQKLKDSYLYIFRTNTRIYYELSKVFKVLKENNIPVIVLKGAALAELIYQDVALRPMSDVDIVVKPEDAWRIDEALKPLGYESDALSKHHVQWLPHIVKSKSLEIDINPAVFELPKLDPWSNARPVKISGNEVFILGPEDFILNTLLHLDRHHIEDGYCNLIWWFDIKKLIESYNNEINWNYVIQIAKKYQVEDSVKRVLHAIDRWFGVSIPKDVLNKLKGSNIIADINGILEPPKMDTKDYKELDSVLASLSSTKKLPSFRKKIYHLFKRMFPDKEHIIWRYSVKRPKMVYFYYLVRAYEVFVKGIKVCLKLPVYLKDKYKQV